MRVPIDDFLGSVSAGPSALLIEGEAGIGKTTSWLSGVQQARRQGMRVLSTRAAAAESVLAYAALADLLDDVDPAVWSELPPPQRLALSRMLRADTDEGASDQRALMAGFLAVVEVLACEGALLLAIDDLQWLDPSSVNVMAYTARRLKGRVGVFATTRTEPGAGDPVPWLQLPRPDDIRRVLVPPLTLGGLHMVLSERLDRSFPRPTMLRIHEISGGNPFYALELARAIANSPDTAEVQLPGSLSELVDARVGRLGREVKEALLAAACAAEPTLDLIARVTGRDVAGVLDLLEPAEANGIVVIEGNRLPFAHPLLARGVYTSAGPTQRRAMHRRLAGIIEEPELRARHLALASTGDPETLAALDEGARIARRRGAPAAAAELIDLALKLGGNTAERQVQSAQHCLAAGDSSRAQAILEATIDRMQSGPLRAEALNALAFSRIFNGTSADAAECFERALEEAGDHPTLRAQTLPTLIFVLTNAGRMDEAQRYVDDAVALANRLGDSHLLRQALSEGVLLQFIRGEGYDELNMHRALELEDRDAETSMLVQPRWIYAMLLSWLGQLDRAHEEFAAIRRRCAEHGQEYELMVVSVSSVHVEIWRGALDAASAIAEDSIERARLLGGVDMLDRYRINRSLVAAYSGHVERARDDADKALAVWERKDAPRVVAWQLMYRGFLEVSLGNYAAALDTLQPLVSMADAAPDVAEIPAAWFFPDAIEAMTALGSLREAEPLIERLERNGNRVDRPWMLAMGARGRAMLLAAQGDLVAASAAGVRAMTEHDRLPMPFERARTQLLVGQLQRRRRQKDLAAATLGEALSTFEKLGTPLWAQRARTELARVNVAVGGAELTPSEQRVAELAASGMTNRDVAAAMFISPKTVEANLSRIYRKMGIRSRAELGRRVGQLDG